MQLATCFIVVLISLEIICRLQGHIHANPPKNEGKVLVSRIFPRPFRARKNTFETRKILGRIICQTIQ